MAVARFNVMRPTLDSINLHHPDYYAANGYPWEAWDLLRREAPVHWYERDDVEPFWAITRYADILEVSDRPDRFINGGPRLRLTLKGKPELLRAGVDTFGTERGWDPDEPPDLSFMDKPRHRPMRKHSSWAFTQSGMRQMRPHFDRLAKNFTEEFIAELRAASAAGETSDLVHGLAAKLPLAAIGEIMGLAPHDWKKILKWSNALVGDFDEQDLKPGESRGRAGYRAMHEMRSYIEQLILDSRRAGRERGGFIDRLVHKQVNNEYLTDQQLIGYVYLLISAGNDTTRNAFAGGVLALLEHPDQRDLLVAEPALLPSAVDEILRWTSPIGNFLRTVTEDVSIAGQAIKAGETVALFYPSANRDDAVFPDPYRFDITRSPNPHLTFGFGAHFCLGTNLARAELLASLSALVPYLKNLEVAGEPRRLAQTHVMGYSEIKTRYVEQP